MIGWPILFVVTVLPLVGTLVLVTLRGEEPVVARNARWTALWTTLITFAVSLILVWRFDPASPDFQFEEKGAWLGGAYTGLAEFPRRSFCVYLLRRRARKRPVGPGPFRRQCPGCSAV